MNLSDMAVVSTACRRPYYLERSLASWAQADGISSLAGFAVALGRSDREEKEREVIGAAGLDARVWPDSDEAAAATGMHRAIAEAARRAFTELPVAFVILTEEDVVVSDDVLRYFAWAATEFEDDPSVLGVCAHSRGGQGWDLHQPAQDQDADQQAVRLLPYFNAWCWGTWLDRWDQILEPGWDWDCDSGGPMNSGWDWCIATKILRWHEMVCAVPDASRSQNIGALEGWASTTESFAFSQAASFRDHRDSAPYRLEAGQ